MTAEIITIASLKDGAGKTTACTAMAAAGASLGLDVVAIDLDPGGGVSRGLESAQRSTTIVDVLERRISLRDALTKHPLGARTVATHRTLADDTLSEWQLRSVLSSVLDDCDLMILDTGTDVRTIEAPLCVADRIIIATALDILSMRAAALTAGLAEQTGVLDRVSGLLIGNVRRPLSRHTDRLLDALSATGLAFDTVMWQDAAWEAAMLPASAELPPSALDVGKRLLREVATRSAPVPAMQQFIGLAQGRRAEPVLSGR